jgi:cytochrome c-type biogenesis protein CcmH/NrfF
VRLLPLAVAVLACAAPALASERHPTQGELESELVCIACHTTLDESDAPIARQMKAYVARRIRQGATKSQIENELVDQFGPGVLGVPRKHGFDLLAWLLPLGGIAAVGAALAVGAWRWSRADEPSNTVSPGPERLDAADERRVDAELERYE